MFNDRNKLEAMFRSMVEIFSAHGAWHAAPCQGVHENVIAAIKESIEQKAFCATLVGWLGGGSAFEIIVLEYLNGNSKQGYNRSDVDPRGFVTIKNCGETPVSFVSKVKQAHRPYTDRKYAEFSGPVNLRTHSSIEPGQEKMVPFRKGYSLLTKYCEFAHHQHAAQLGLPTGDPNGRLVEVGGGIVSHDDSDEFSMNGKQITWGKKNDSVRSGK